MTLRTKSLLIFIAFGIAPMLVLGVVNYLNGARAVERLLREDAEGRASYSARKIEAAVGTGEARLAAWASSPEIRAYLRSPAETAVPSSAAKSARPAPSTIGASPPVVTRSSVPAGVRAAAGNLLLDDQNHFESLTLLDQDGRALFRAEVTRNTDGTGDGQREVHFVTEDIPSSAVRADQRVWAATEANSLRAPVSYEPYGACVRSTFPIFDEGQTRKAAGALVAEIRLGALVEEITEANAGGTPLKAAPHVIALDNPTGRIIYHTGGALGTQPVAVALPAFAGVAARMRARADGASEFYDAPGGDRWLAAFRQVGGLDASVAVARDYTAAAAGVRRAGAISLALPFVAGAAALLLLVWITGRASERIERVAEGAAAIARGDLGQRIDVAASGETKVLAESFNLMSDRLRDHIAREAETKQFESFMRLSAMLTHDLKNSITGLSMLVNNMERQFHRAEFRADAISSLREATDKLRRIVARLNEPVKSLSGEYRRSARETDLVPVINRVVAVNAAPSAALYKIETRLPATLPATVEPERIENVVENLVINALEAMGTEGGRLTIEAGTLEDGHIFLSVADTGRGMSAEFVNSRLFRPFATTKTKGIGLGLFTCREIVETHGGRLEVESQPGVGTRFRVVLPSNLFSTRDRPRHPQKGAVAASRNERGA